MVNTSRILLAVSNTSDPNGTWNYFAINSKVTPPDGIERWANYPGFASDGSAVYVTSNLATDADSDALTYSLSGGTLPAGITFNADGSFFRHPNNYSH